MRRNVLIGTPHPETVTWNQLAMPFNAEWREIWNSSMVDATFDNNVATITWKQAGKYGYNTSLVKTSGKTAPTALGQSKLYIAFDVHPSFTTLCSPEIYGVTLPTKSVTANQWTRLSWIHLLTASSSTTSYNVRELLPVVRTSGAQIGSTVDIKNELYVDLTKMYGRGNEPDIETFELELRLNGITMQTEYDQSGTLRTWWRW